MATSPRCTKTIHHLSRIQGQIDSLKRAIEEEQSCEQVARLCTSIVRSFDSARTTIVEEYLTQELLGGDKISAGNAEKLSHILSLYKA